MREAGRRSQQSPLRADGRRRRHIFFLQQSPMQNARRLEDSGKGITLSAGPAVSDHATRRAKSWNKRKSDLWLPLSAAKSSREREDGTERQARQKNPPRCALKI